MISFTSSGSGLLQPGNVFSIDDLEFELSTGMEELTAASPAWIADDQLHLPSAQINDQVRVVDALGRELLTAVASSAPFTLDLYDIPKGVVMVELLRSNGERQVMRLMR